MTKAAAGRNRPSSARGAITLVLGGASSGKSEAALTLAGTKGPRAFVATGQALDEEMAERIARHRASRDHDWAVHEVPVELARWFESHGKAYRVVLLDCLTLWLSNLLGARAGDVAVMRQVADLIGAMRTSRACVVIVSNEIGMGLVPADKATRRFRDLAGRINQAFAEAARDVWFVVGGQKLRLK